MSQIGSLKKTLKNTFKLNENENTIYKICGTQQKQWNGNL